MSYTEYLGYVYTGPAEYLSGQILGRLSNRPKQRSVRHCVHSGPVYQVHDMRIERIVPNLLLIQSDEFANVRNWRTKEKESDTNFILAEESRGGSSKKFEGCTWLVKGQRFQKN